MTRYYVLPTAETTQENFFPPRHFDYFLDAIEFLKETFFLSPATIENFCVTHFTDSSKMIYSENNDFVFLRYDS